MKKAADCNKILEDVALFLVYRGYTRNIPAYHGYWKSEIPATFLTLGPGAQSELTHAYYVFFRS